MASPAPSSLPPTNASSVAPPPANTSSPTPISPVASPPSPPAEVSPPPASSETSPAPASSSPLPPSSSTTSSPPPPPTSTGKIPSPTTHSSPPPPPHHHSRPSSSSPSPPSSSSSNISTGVVIGVAIGGVVLLVCVSLLCICCKKKKRGRHPPEDYYYGPPPLEPKERPYDRPQQWQHNAPLPADNYVSMPPKPSPPPADNFVPMPPKPSPPPANASRMPLLSVPSQPSASTLSSGGSSNSSVYEIHPPPLPPPPPFGLRAFTYEELEMATEGFSAGNMLGQGGFGYVHKGVLLDGKVVAVKSLKSGSGQGDREFQAEVEIISRVHHKHLVSLVGYCIVGLQRMLVYEYVPNDTLEYHLHEKGRPVMDWPSRLRIALGAAKGLAYLHEDCSPKIIHRDIKASNILLDSNFEAKVADFGLAKFCSDAYTHVSTRVMGTFGYLAPEYAATGKLSDKSDVFSFGIMLLELITGRSPSFSAELSKHDCLIDWARPLLTQALENDDYESLVDERLQSYEKSEMAHMVACASACVRHSARRRPCMSQVVRALEGEMSLLSLNEGLRPTAYRGNHGSHESSDYDTIQYKEYMNKMQKTAIGSQESETSESSGYGLYLSGSSSEYQQSVRTTREMEMGKMKKHGQGGFTGSF